MGITESVTNGIWLTRVVLDEYEVRGALLVTGTHALVWDTLSRPRDMSAFHPFLCDRELIVVYSHADWDHVWGTAGLPYPEARIIAHERAVQRFRSDVPKALAEKQASEPGRWDGVTLVAPNESFDGERAIELGEMTLHLHHLPGHTADCIVGFVPERGLLLAGDTVETPCPVVPADSPLTDWIAGLRRWADDPHVRTVVPAHGPVGDRELLRQNIRYLEAIAAGKAIEPPGPLTDFYRTTHRQNVQWRPPAG